MTWNLFIDDERNVEDVTWAPNNVQEKYHNEEWVVVRTYDEAFAEIYKKGAPQFISFDHDLGDKKPTGFAIAKALVEAELDNEIFFSNDFDFYVHSKNPVGKANIEAYISGYLAAKLRTLEMPATTKRFNELYDVLTGEELGNITVGNLK